MNKVSPAGTMARTAPLPSGPVSGFHVVQTVAGAPVVLRAARCLRTLVPSWVFPRVVNSPPMYTVGCPSVGEVHPVVPPTTIVYTAPLGSGSHVCTSPRLLWVPVAPRNRARLSREKGLLLLLGSWPNWLNNPPA